MPQLPQPSAAAVQRHADALRNSPTTSDANDDHVRCLVGSVSMNSLSCLEMAEHATHGHWCESSVQALSESCSRF